MFKIKGKSITAFKFVVMLVDILIIASSYYAAFRLRFGKDRPSASIMDLEVALPYICVIAVVLLYVYGMYSVLGKKNSDVMVSIALISVMLMILSMATVFFTRSFAFPRTIFVIAAVIQMIALSLWRIAVLRIRKLTFGRKDILVIGHYPEIEDVTCKIISSSGDLYNVRYMFDLKNDFAIAHKLIKNVDYVFICSEISNEEKSRIISYCMAEDKHIFIIPKLFEISISNSKLVQFDDLPTFYVENFRLPSDQRALKRTIDVLLSAVGIVLTSPIMLVAAILVKSTSPGPVLYKQERVTENNKIFKLLKFRTMVNNAEEHSGPVLASENDPRITKVGRFLRAIRLDELPQLFNILFGDMSIVGPRPERPFFIEKFKNEIPYYEYRLTVKAGLTGLAQILGKYSTDAADKVKYDLLYIRNYSIWLDIKLILQTMRVIFKRSSSAGRSIEEKNLAEILKDFNCSIHNGDSFAEVRKEVTTF